MIIGHQRIWQFLSKSAAGRRLAHAYLFVGSSGIGKKKVALEFAKLLQCKKSLKKQGNFGSCGECRDCLLIERNQHPDVLLIESDNETSEAKEGEKQTKIQEIKIEQIKALQHQINLSPYSGEHKIVIIDSSQNLTHEAANCLLKTLEEPSQKSVLILVSSSWQKLLPTIVSRCQIIKFSPVKSHVIVEGLQKLGAKNKAKIIQAVRFACGRPGVALKIINEPQFLAKNIQLIEELEGLMKKDLVERFRYAKDLSQNSVNAKEVLDQWVIWFRDKILSLLGNKGFLVLGEENSKNIFSLAKIIEAIKNIQQTQRLLEDSSFNSRLILENLMLKI